MRVLVTGGTGVLGRAFRPLAEAAGHDVRAPGRAELDLFDPLAVGAAVRDQDAVLHLATRIQPLERMQQPEAWRENDRLRAQASAILVDAALGADVKTYVQPTVTFVYPGDRPVSEQTPLGRRSAHLAFRAARRAAGRPVRRGGAARCRAAPRAARRPGHRPRPAQPEPGATLNAEDAGRALLVALMSPPGCTTCAAMASGSATAVLSKRLAGVPSGS